MMLRPLSLPFMLLAVFGPAPSHPQVDTSGFQQQVSFLADNILGVKAFQQYLDSQITYKATQQSRQDLLNELKQDLQDSITTRVSAVRELRDTIQANFGNFGTQTGFDACCACCSNPDEYGRLKFKNDVELSSVCHVGQGMTSSVLKHYPNQAVLDKMRRNYDNNPNLKWQYFGGEDGIMTIYPANKKCDSEFDPRYRSWYSGTAFGQPKDLVIILDRSGSMRKFHGSKTLMKIAQEAAGTVLDTLNPDDRVGLVFFSTDASSPASGCYRSNLAEATPENKAFLQAEINNVISDGNTMYSLAFQEAFKYFGTNWKRPQHDRLKIILFLTDGQPSEQNDDTYLNVIRDGNRQMDNQVIIHTFGLGADITTDVKNKLTRIAEQANADQAAGNVTAGRFVHVSNPNELRSSMARYYDFLSNVTFSDTITVAVPYVDAFGLGFITSVCLPVHIDDKFRGVTCIDMTLSDLFSDVTYFSQSAASYAFLADDRARLILHPLLPRPQDVNSDPTLLHIRDLETREEMEEVVNSITSGLEGEKSFTSLRILSRGDSTHDGVDTRSLPSHYLWAPLDFGGLQLCIVIADSDKMSSLQTNKRITSLPYHRLDLRPSANTCRHIDRIAITDTSTVMLAPYAFLSLDSYFEQRETEDIIAEYLEYFAGRSQEIEFKHGVQQAVYVSQQFDAVLNKSTNAWQSAVWRYMALREGVFRLYPGTKLPKTYDFTLRPWYKVGVAKPQLIMFSKPYVDTFGAGIIVTLSKALYEGNPSGLHQNDDPLAGVMGMDFTLDLFNSFLSEKVPVCQSKSCIVIDDSGYIVSHPDFVRVEVEDFSNIENVHITQKEPAIASDLVLGNILNKDNCINYSELKIQTFWRVIGLQANSPLFDMVAVTGTNLFVIVTDGTEDPSKTCSCTTDRGLEIPQCSSAAVDCECPCFSRQGVKYDPCNVTFTFDQEIGDSPPCTPPSPKINFSSVADEEMNTVAELDFCYDVKSACPEKDSQLACSSTAGCLWCGKSCAPRTYDGCPKSSSKNLVAIIVPIVVILVVAGVIIGVVVWIKTRRGKPSGPPSGVSVNNPAFTNESWDTRPPPTAPTHVSNDIGFNEAIRR